MNPIHNIIVNAVNEEVHTAIREHIREHKTFQSVLHLMVHNELNELVVAIGRVNNPDKTAEYWDKEREQMDNESTAEVMNKYDLDD